MARGMRTTSAISSILNARKRFWFWNIFID
jgi:hypothetical protein